MEKLKELVFLCKGSVDISVNIHKDFYQSVKSYIDHHKQMDDEIIDDIGVEVYNEMIKRDTVVKIQAYPNTPVGSYKIYHYDIDEAVNLMLNAVRGGS